MKKFKSITVNESTFDAVVRLTETLLPKVKLSKAQVVEHLVKKKKEEYFFLFFTISLSNFMLYSPSNSFSNL